MTPVTRRTTFAMSLNDSSATTGQYTSVSEGPNQNLNPPRWSAPKKKVGLISGREDGISNCPGAVLRASFTTFSQFDSARVHHGNYSGVPITIARPESAHGYVGAHHLFKRFSRFMHKNNLDAFVDWPAFQKPNEQVFRRIHSFASSIATQCF